MVLRTERVPAIDHSQLQVASTIAGALGQRGKPCSRTASDASPVECWEHFACCTVTEHGLLAYAMKIHEVCRCLGHKLFHRIPRAQSCNLPLVACTGLVMCSACDTLRHWRHCVEQAPRASASSKAWKNAESKCSQGCSIFFSHDDLCTPLSSDRPCSRDASQIQELDHWLCPAGLIE